MNGGRVGVGQLIYKTIINNHAECAIGVVGNVTENGTGDTDYFSLCPLPFGKI